MSKMTVLESVVRKVLRTIFLPLRRQGIQLPERLFRHLHMQGPFEIDLSRGRKRTLMSWGNRVENELIWRGWKGHEPDAMSRWVQLAESGEDILDIGANTGTFAFIRQGCFASIKGFCD